MCFKENDVMINEADQERNRLCRERNDLSRKQQDLTEVVATLRGELVSSEKKIRELEADNLHVGSCTLVLILKLCYNCKNSIFGFVICIKMELFKN